MTPIFALLQFLHKQENVSTLPNIEEPTTGGPSLFGGGQQPEPAGGASTPTSDMEREFGPQGHDRLYLSEIGGKVPEGFKGKTYTGARGSPYIDRRLVTPEQIEALHPKDKNKDTAYGGMIMINHPTHGTKVVLRKPKGGHRGYNYTIPKGGANPDESPEDAALREVLEETGYECRIVGEMPGHFQSGVNNRMFLMEPVGGSPTQFQDDETEDVKSFTYAEAEAEINKTENEDGRKRDLHLLKYAFSTHKENKDDEKMGANIQAKLDALKPPEQTSLSAGAAVKIFGEAVDHFLENGEFPDSFLNREHPDFDKWIGVRKMIYNRLIDGSDQSQTCKDFTNAFWAKYSKNKGYNEYQNPSRILDKMTYKMSESADKVEGAILSEYMAELYGNPQVRWKGQNLSVTIDEHGNLEHYTLEQVSELVEAYDKWREEGGPSTGKLPDKYDPEHERFEGKSYDFEIGGWEIAAQVAKNSLPQRKNHSAEIDDFAVDNSLMWPHTADEDEVVGTLEDYKKGGKHFLDDNAWYSPKERHNIFLNRHRMNAHMRNIVKQQLKLTKGMLDLAVPDSTDYIVYRNTTAAEVTKPWEDRSDFWEHHITEDAPTHEVVDEDESLKRMYASGFPKNVDEERKRGGPNAYHAYVYSRPLVNGSIFPQGMGASSDAESVNVVMKVPKENMFMLPFQFSSLHSPEQETLMSLPNRFRARVFHSQRKHNSLLSRDTAFKFSPKRNGYEPENTFYHDAGVDMGVHNERGENVGSWGVGVAEPHRDWAEEGSKKKLKDMGGSAPGGLYTADNGDEYYIKHGREHQHVIEDLANTIYRHVGIPVPESELINYDGKVAHSSKMVDGQVVADLPSPSKFNHPDIKNGHLVDCLLGNWDVAGTGDKPYGNLLFGDDGKVYRIDNGGALDLSGSGATKPVAFGPVRSKPALTEMDRFMEPDNLTSGVLGEMSVEDYQRALEPLYKLDNTAIAQLVNDSGVPPTDMDRLVQTLISRRNNIIQWAVDKGYTDDLSFAEIEQKHAFYKSEPSISEALEVLKKRPVIYLKDLRRNEDD